MNVNKPSANFFQLPGMKRPPTRESFHKENKLPLVTRLPDKVRSHFVAMVGEFCGTFLFLFLAFAGAQIANAASAAEVASKTDLLNAPNTSVLLYIALVFGFSLMINVWIFVRISGGLFNPAVTLALALIGGITWVRAALVFIAETLAAIAAAGVVVALFPGAAVIATNLSPGTSPVRGLFIEMFLTAELIFTICMLAVEKHKGNFLAPVGIGVALFVAELAGVYFTGGSLNPARSFGPCVVHRSFPSYHWIYWVGPGLGALLAVGFYRFVKLVEYETANPDKNADEKERKSIEIDEDHAASVVDVSHPAVNAPPSPSQAMGKSYTTPDHALNPNHESDARPNETSDHRATNDPSSVMHPGFGDAGDAAYRNSTQAEEGNMRTQYN